MNISYYNIQIIRCGILNNKLNEGLNECGIKPMRLFWTFLLFLENLHFTLLIQLSHVRMEHGAISWAPKVLISDECRSTCMKFVPTHPSYLTSLVSKQIFARSINSTNSLSVMLLWQHWRRHFRDFIQIWSPNMCGLGAPW